MFYAISSGSLKLPSTFTSFPENERVSKVNKAPLDSDFYKGLTLALSSCVFIGTSFIVKKKGLLRAATGYGRRASKSYFSLFDIQDVFFANSSIQASRTCHYYYFQKNSSNIKQLLLSA